MFMRKSLLAVALLLAVVAGSAHAKTNITWGVWATGGGNGDVPYQELKVAFEAKNPDVGVDLVVLSSTEYAAKMQTMIAGGAQPDVHLSRDTDFPYYAQAGLIKDLGPYIERDPAVKLNEFFQAGINAVTINKRIMGLPKDLTTHSLFYNVDMFAQAGLAEPVNITWDQLVTSAKRLTQRDSDGLVTRWGISDTMDFLNWLYSNHGQLLSDDFKVFTLGNTAGREALRFYQELGTVHKVAPTGSADLRGKGTDAWFKDGSAAIYVGGSWNAKFFDTLKNLSWNVARIPYATGKSSVSRLGVGIYVMSSTTRNDKAAWEFIKFATSAEGLRIMAKYAAHAVPPRRTIDMPTAFTGTVVPYGGRRILEAMETAKMPPMTPYYTKVNDLLNQYMPQLKAGQISPDELVTRLADPVAMVLAGK